MLVPADIIDGGWGYLQFVDLGMYYVHGRWYRPDLGRFISPDEKGEYLYGSGDDAVNYAWAGEAGALKFSMTELYEKYLLRRKVRDDEWIAVDFDFALAHAAEWNGDVGITLSGRPYYPAMTELYIWEKSKKYVFEGKPTLIQTLHEMWNTWPQLLPEGGAIAAGIISESRNRGIDVPISGGRPSLNQISKIEAHLSRFGPDRPNQAMIERLKSGKWTEYDQRFFEHETIEADFMAQGMSYDQAHLKASQVQGIPHTASYTSYLYHPDVIRMFPDEFNPAAHPKP